MHVEYNVINKTELETEAPFEIIPEVPDIIDPNANPLDNVVEIDEPGIFSGEVSSRQIDMILDILADNGMY